MKTDITVFYPCFNQPYKLVKSLETLRSQTYSNYRVILMDDCSSIDYSFVMEAFSDLSITRIVNPVKLGAVPNMIHCIHYAVETMYKIVFHEDDLLHPQWLEFAVMAMRTNKGRVSWAASNMSFFKEPSSVLFESYKEIPEFLANDIHALASAIVKGRTLSFASVVYDTEYVRHVKFLHQEYSMLGDRHLLLEMGKNFGFIYFDYDFVSAYDHTSNDYRWKTLRLPHLINFYYYLGSFFSVTELKNKEIVSGFTKAIIENIKLLPEISECGKLKLYYSMYKLKLFSLKYYLLTFSSIRILADRLKF